MTNWELKINKDFFYAVIVYMLKVVKNESSVVHYDESHVMVLQEKTDNGNPKKCQMLVVKTEEEEKKQIVVFSFRTTRMAKEATDILSGYDANSGQSERLFRNNGTLIPFRAVRLFRT